MSKRKLDGFRLKQDMIARGVSFLFHAFADLGLRKKIPTKNFP